VKRRIALLALAIASLAVGLAADGSSQAATRECRGFRVCVPVRGPWVVVPTLLGVPRPRVEYQLRCPRGYVVGGLDAELSDRSIDIFFQGKLGTPVNPGITTGHAAVFVATYTGAAARVTTFRPHVGCIPSSGGGSRSPTVVQAFPPGQPLVRRVSTVRPLADRLRRAVRACTAGERLIGASHAVGFYTRTPPSAQLTASVAVAQSLGDGHVAISVRGGSALRGVRAEVQVHALCAGGGR
jgi:hypothetical protein